MKFIILNLVLYAAACFLVWDANPQNWGSDGRYYFLVVLMTANIIMCGINFKAHKD